MVLLITHTCLDYKQQSIKFIYFSSLSRKHLVAFYHLSFTFQIVIMEITDMQSATSLKILALLTLSENSSKFYFPKSA